MNDRQRDAVSRSEFLRRTGALGVAGAASLGLPLPETRPVGAAPLSPAADMIAAGGGATVKIGHIDGFSGVYAAASESQQTGLQAAVDNWNRKNSRMQFTIVQAATTRTARGRLERSERLISQEKVDICGCLRSAVGLAVSAIAEENGTLFVAMGTHDTNITGPKANSVSPSGRRARTQCWLPPTGPRS